MRFQQPAPFGDAAELVQIPEPSADLVDRTDQDVVLADLVADRSLESAGLGVGWSAGS